MRYINRERVNILITQQWHKKVEGIKERVKNTPQSERNQIINGSSRIWSEVKEKLCEASYGKCWYCETKDVRFDYEVDHWRPKNEVKDRLDHPGYWWLAFEWSNFRYSCEHCNQFRRARRADEEDGGKSTAFPLFDESKRICDECHLSDLLQEEPLLLDPMVLTDTSLLGFDVDGTARPAKNKKSFPKEYWRAEESIKIYHLNFTDLKEKRQVTACNEVERLIKDGEEYLYHIGQNENNSAAKLGYSRIVDQLSLMIHERSEYSAAAKSVMRSNRKKYPWVEEILDAS